MTMTREQIKQRIKEIGVIPVVRAKSPEQAILATKAVHAGGIACVEITMTVPGAIDVIRTLAAELASEVLIGAGTVLDVRTAERCIAAGAQFIVSPALNLETIAAAQEAGKVAMPGALTPTEVVTAWQAGADFVKIFPCGNLGGAKYLKALKGPLPDVEMIPTGGVNLNSAGEMIAAGASALGVGSELVDAKALAANSPDVITSNAKEFVRIVQLARTSIQVKL